MATKSYKPTSPGKRSRKTIVVSKTDQPKQKRLLVALSSAAGRNNKGRITVRGRSGGRKRKYRLIDFQRNKDGIKGIIKTIEYDPYRTSLISLINYEDGDKRYILTPANAKIGDLVSNGVGSEIKSGNTLPLKNIPEGSIVHNIEINKGKGAQVARSAGCNAVLQAKTGKYAAIKFPSGEVRLILSDCVATMGQLSNSEHRNTVVGKAGANRWKGKRPKVRGAAMNPCDHPHGGGEGKAPVGLPGPRTAAGTPALGFKTRKKSKDKQNKKKVLRYRS